MPQPPTEAAQAELLDAARRGDPGAFDRLVAAYRGELAAHCYRMLGSVQDAEDALQETLLGAWRGLGGFAGRSSLRTWLYRIATNACLRLIARRPRRLRTPEYGPPLQDPTDLGEPVTGPVWLEPWPQDLEDLGDLELGAGADDLDPAARLLRRESVELAFVAALQHLPGTQRAVLILREVLEFPAAEVARILQTTPASVNSALQRARRTLAQHRPPTTQQAELAALGPSGERKLVDAFVTAWERADVPALLQLLAEDARFTMPPLPAWFHGRAAIRRFLTERMFATPWRLLPIRANSQLAFACYYQDQPQQDPEGRASADTVFRLGAINVVSLRGGEIGELNGFIDPALHRHVPVLGTLPADGDPTVRPSTRTPDGEIPRR